MTDAQQAAVFGIGSIGLEPGWKKTILILTRENQLYFLPDTEHHIRTLLGACKLEVMAGGDDSAHDVTCIDGIIR